MPTREEIAQAIYDSQRHYIGSLEDCLIAADAVLALSSKHRDVIEARRILEKGDFLGAEESEKVINDILKPSQNTYIAVEIYDDEIRYGGKTIFRGKFHTDEVDGIVNAYKANQAKTSGDHK